MVTHANIHEAKIAVMADVEYVQKNGVMKQGKGYKYVAVDDVIARLRPAMVEHGIHFSPTGMNVMFQEQYQTSGGTMMNRVILGVSYRLSHVSGSYEDGYSVGEASDSGDKACNKAMTAAKKYALLQSFCLETGEDDPDHDPSSDQERGKANGANGKANGKASSHGAPTKLQEFHAKLVSLKPPQLVERIVKFDEQPDKAIETFGSKDDADVARAVVVSELYKKLDIDVGFQSIPKKVDAFSRWFEENAQQFLAPMQVDTLRAKIERQRQTAQETADKM